MKLVFRLPIALLLLFIYLNSGAQTLSDIDLIRTKINSYQYSEALQLIEENLSYLSDNLEQREIHIDMITLKAQVLKRSYKLDEAIETITSALNPEKIEIRLLLELADCHKVAGDYLSALETYNIANMVSPSTFIETEIAVLNFHVEEWQNTIEFGKRVLERDTITTMLRVVGDSYNKCEDIKGHKDSALVYYNKVMERKPNDALTLSKICNIYLQRDSIQKVLKLTEKFLEKGTDHPSIFEIYGLALHLSKRYEDSYQIFKFLIENGAISFASYYYAGYNLFLMQRYYDAIPYFEQAKSIDPGNINNIYHLATAQIHSEMINESFKNLDEGLGTLLSQDSLTIYKFYSAYSFGMTSRSKYDESIKYLFKAQKFYPENHAVLFNIASVYERKKDYKRAKEYYSLYITETEKAHAGKSDKYKNQENYRIAKNKITEMDIELFYREEK